MCLKANYADAVLVCHCSLRKLFLYLDYQSNYVSQHQGTFILLLFYAFSLFFHATKT